MLISTSPDKPALQAAFGMNAVRVADGHNALS
jgi:hypothetical protein